MGFWRSTLVDLKNGLPPRAVADRIHPTGVVFVHVPKCAGTSVERALRQHYRLSRITIDPEASFTAAETALSLTANDETRNDVLMKASEARRDLLNYHLATGYKCITGHAPLGETTISANTHHFITILRDPVERYLSHLAFNLEGQGGHGRIDEPVEAFLERPRATVMGALYGKYFSGLPMTADFSSAEAVAAAKGTLSQMALIGFLDQLDNFEAQVSVLLGHKIRIGHKNKTVPASGKQTLFPDNVVNKVKTLCASDIEIHQWAVEQMHQSPA